jgi:hypothetical protein
MGQEGINQYFGRMAVNPNETLFNEAAQKRYADSFVGGAALGGAMGGATGWRRSSNGGLDLLKTGENNAVVTAAPSESAIDTGAAGLRERQQRAADAGFERATRPAFDLASYAQDEGPSYQREAPAAPQQQSFDPRQATIFGETSAPREAAGRYTAPPQYAGGLEFDNDQMGLAEKDAVVSAAPSKFAINTEAQDHTGVAIDHIRRELVQRLGGGDGFVSKLAIDTGRMVGDDAALHGYLTQAQAKQDKALAQLDKKVEGGSSTIAPEAYEQQRAVIERRLEALAQARDVLRVPMQNNAVVSAAPSESAINTEAPVARVTPNADGRSVLLEYGGRSLTASPSDWGHIQRVTGMDDAGHLANPPMTYAESAQAEARERQAQGLAPLSEEGGRARVQAVLANYKLGRRKIDEITSTDAETVSPGDLGLAPGQAQEGVNPGFRQEESFADAAGAGLTDGPATNPRSAQDLVKRHGANTSGQIAAAQALERQVQAKPKEAPPTASDLEFAAKRAELARLAAEAEDRALVNSEIGQVAALDWNDARSEGVLEFKAMPAKAQADWARRSVEVTQGSGNEWAAVEAAQRTFEKENHGAIYNTSAAASGASGQRASDNTGLPSADAANDGQTQSPGEGGASRAGSPVDTYRASPAADERAEPPIAVTLEAADGAKLHIKDARATLATLDTRISALNNLLACLRK